MRRQKEQVETAIGADVASVRHHHLHFDIRRTARVQHRAGLLFDSSLGFNDNIGFRCETSYPWRLRDMQTGQPQGVLELPLAIQDKCLMRTRAHGSEELALEWLARLAARVKHVGGLLTLLWHPESLHKPPYVAVYQRALTLLAEHDAWFGTMSEIGRWWSKVNSHIGQDDGPQGRKGRNREFVPKAHLCASMVDFEAGAWGHRTVHGGVDSPVITCPYPDSTAALVPRVSSPGRRSIPIRTAWRVRPAAVALWQRQRILKARRFDLVVVRL
jgi:hypothetical protein